MTMAGPLPAVSVSSWAPEKSFGLSDDDVVRLPIPVADRLDQEEQERWGFKDLDVVRLMSVFP